MSKSDDVRKKLADLAAKRSSLEKEHSDASGRQAAKSAEHARYLQQAGRASSEGSRRSYLGLADRAQTAALAEGKKIADLSRKRADLAKDEGAQQKALAEALKRESAEQEAKAKKARQDEERRRVDERRADERRRAEQKRDDERRRAEQRPDDERRQAQARSEERAWTDRRVEATEQRLSERIEAATRPPQREQLRILYATANPDGGLRVEEEIRRVKAVVKMSTHRDQVLIEHLPAATRVTCWTA